jgi:hypothetical protein
VRALAAAPEQLLYNTLATWDTGRDGVLECWELIGGGRALLSSLRHALK